MSYKQQIEKKARDYANSQFKKGYVEGKPNFTCVDLDFAYRAGAEAMREIANTWIPVVDRLPEEAGLYLCKCNSNRLGFYYEIVFFNKVWRSDNVIGWRPIE